MDARSICQSFHSEVASIHSQQENSYIRRLAVSNGTMEGVLLGGAMTGKGVDFVWIDGSQWDYSNFRTGYPMSGMGECLYMDTATTAGEWINSDCDKPMMAVCAHRADLDPQPINPSDPRYGAYKNVSDLLGSWMNTSIDPCDDFYAFTCGGGTSGQPTSFDRSGDANMQSMLRWLKQPANAFDKDPKAVQQVKWFYDSCMKGATNDEWAERSKKIFLDLRAANPSFGFPALYPDQTYPATPQELASFLGYLMGSSGFGTLIVPWVNPNMADPQLAESGSKNGYALYVDQPYPMYSSTFYQTFYPEEKDSVVTEFLDTINAAANLLGMSFPDQKQAMKDAQDMAQLDYDLATKYSEESNTPYANMYNPMELHNLPPFIDWKIFFDKALTPISKTVDDSFESIIMNPNGLNQLSEDILRGVISPRTLNNYLYIRVLHSNYLPYFYETRKKASLLHKFRQDKKDIHAKRRSAVKKLTKDFNAQEVSCVDSASSYLSYASSRIFAESNYPSQKDKQSVIDQQETFIGSLISAFTEQIGSLDWMSSAAKDNAYKKLDNLVLNIAFPKWVLDDMQLAEHYQELDIKQGDSYLDQLDKLYAFDLYESLSPLLFQGPADRTEFGAFCGFTNLWYQPDQNSLTIPGGILHDSVYNPDYPAAFNYGALGAFEAHELTHGADALGRQWDFDGRLGSWMDANSQAGFDSSAQCVIDQYDYFCPLPGTCVNGVQTEVENIADSGGIQIAYRAFQTYRNKNGVDPLLPGDASVFNADQLFFLAFAQTWCQSPPYLSMMDEILFDVHSPPLYRVLGTLQNTEAFKDAFNCPVGSTYAPRNHCKVWTPYFA